MQNIVICLEPPEYGKFVLVDDRQNTHRFFVGLGEGDGAADHKTNYDKAHTYFDSRSQEGSWRKKGEWQFKPHHPVVLKSFNDAERYAEPFLDTIRPFAGGHYIFDENCLILRGRSARYGQASEDVLREFEQPILEYCSRHNINLERVILE